MEIKIKRFTMKYTEFEDLISSDRMRKYIAACGNDTRKAMKLYRLNLKLSQEMFTVISCFEVTLRNKIDKVMRQYFGGDWLRDSVAYNGIFYTDNRVEQTRKIITKAYNELVRENNYSHTKLLSQMEFGVWKFMFNNVQYRLSGRHLLSVFPNKPRSTPQMRIDNSKIFLELDYINNIRNRIAHHKPICFGKPVCISDVYVRVNYNRIRTLFAWMGVDSKRLLYGMDNVETRCVEIMNF